MHELRKLFSTSLTPPWCPNLHFTWQLIQSILSLRKRRFEIQFFFSFESVSLTTPSTLTDNSWRAFSRSFAVHPRFQDEACQSGGLLGFQAVFIFNDVAWTPRKKGVTRYHRGELEFSYIRYVKDRNVVEIFPWGMGVKGYSYTIYFSRRSIRLRKCSLSWSLYHKKDY